MSRCSMQELWLDKGSVCINLGLYQSARSLLAEAYLVAKVRKGTYKWRTLASGCMFPLRW